MHVPADVARLSVPRSEVTEHQASTSHAIKNRMCAVPVERPFSVHGTLAEAWARMKGLRPRENPARRDGGDAGRLAAPEPIEPHADRRRPVTPGADRGYDAADLAEELRTNVRPPVARNVGRRRSAIDGRTTRPACPQTDRGVWLDQDPRLPKRLTGTAA